MYSKEFIEKVRDGNNIVNLFTEYTQFKRSGGRMMGLCPFPGHLEKTPSFSVSEDKQVYHCFGCQRSGNIYTALQELKGLSFPECVEYLANQAGIALPTERVVPDEVRKAKSLRDKKLKINEIAAEFFHRTLLRADPSHPVRKYCELRGLTPEIIKNFRIGYAPAGWDGLVQALKAAHAPLDLALELGLIRKRKDGDGYFDLFRDRLMFTIESHKSECVGFGGRSLTAEQQPKYLNSPESDLFSKGHLFYGLVESAKHIRAEGQGIVVEGYMDFLALHAAGFRNVVATLGTALTPHHAKLMGRYSPNVLVLFDGDEAGQDAAERSLPILLAEGLLPKGVFLPDELDPDEYINEHGAPKLREVLSHASDLFSVVLDRHLLSYRGGAADKVKLLDTILPLLRTVSDRRLSDLYVKELAQKLGVESMWISRQLDRPQRSNYDKTSAEPLSGAENRSTVTTEMPKDVINLGAKITLDGASQAELFLLNIALMDSTRFNAVLDSGVTKELSHSGVKEMFERAESMYRQMPSEFAKLSANLMLVTNSPQGLTLYLGEPLVSMDSGGLDKLMGDCIRQVKEKFWRRQTREIAASLKTSPTEEQAKKLEQIMNIQKNKHTLRRDRET